MLSVGAERAVASDDRLLERSDPKPPPRQPASQAASQRLRGVRARELPDDGEACIFL